MSSLTGGGGLCTREDWSLTLVEFNPPEGRGRSRCHALCMAPRRTPCAVRDLYSHHQTTIKTIDYCDDDICCQKCFPSFFPQWVGKNWEEFSLYESKQKIQHFEAETDSTICPQHSTAIIKSYQTD